jgi:hypothetical protein
MNPLNVHRNRHGQQALPVFVANLDGNFAGIPLGQQIASDARGCLCGFSLRCIKVGELYSLVVGDEPRPLADIEIKARQGFLGKRTLTASLAPELPCI